MSLHGRRLKGAAQRTGVAAGFGVEAEIEVDLEKALLQQAVGSIERGVVVAAEEMQGRQAHGRGEVFRRQMFEDVWRKVTLSCGKRKRDVRQDRGGARSAEQGNVLCRIGR